MKEAAYKGMVPVFLEYGSSVWDPHTKNLEDELEKVQNRAARFVTMNYVYETGILGQLKWETRKKRRKDNRLILLYKGLKGNTRTRLLSAACRPLLCTEYATDRITFSVSAASVVLTCDLIPSNHQKCHVLLIIFSITLMAHSINGPVLKELYFPVGRE